MSLIQDYDDQFPSHVPDTDDQSDFPHSILKPQDSDSTTDHPTMGDPAEGVVDTFYGIDHAPSKVESAPTSLVEIEPGPDLAVTQDARWHRGLVVLEPGTRGLQSQTLQVNGGANPTRIVRENMFRRSVLVMNPPSPVGDGASVIWIAQTQADAKVNAGFPLVAGASVSLEYSGDLWAVSSNANGSLVSVIASVFNENVQ